ncbi:latrophilin Cirl [Lepeophtheirus salmonis]|uniref:latrophilin Cirl n=1 Tax=Lepeophtheirus salmonis TaxID=72036 RepID=UPI001AE1F050|nr:latrophilin Cirl-like [Lepeophtheirus salmonis]
MSVLFLSVLLVLFSGIFGAPGPFPQGEDPDGTKYKTAYKCEGDDIFIKCDVSGTIRVIRANYGRFSIAICNKHGYTDWSVNCMSPRTTRVFQNKCDGRMNCTMPVNSNVFGDPCPQTQKYVEVHYACIPKFQTTTTKKPLPPWFLENGASELWNSKISLEDQTSTSSLTPTTTENKKETDPTMLPAPLANDRRPIMVTHPSTPVRIPITTPRIITTSSASSTTTKDSSTTTVSTSSTTVAPTLEFDPYVESSEFPIIEQADSIEIINMDKDDLKNLCSSTESRNVVWPWTQKGDIAIVQCPHGATGLARWACVEDESDFGSEWAGIQPDMSDCKSIGMTDLEVRVREKESENTLAYSLAHLTASKDIYGGDLESSVTVLRTISNRINFLLKNDADSFYNGESYIQETFQNVIRSAGNLIARKHREAWNDVHRSRQMKIANSLIISLQENALLLAKVIDNPEFLEEISTNIMMALSVSRVNFNTNGTGYPLKSSSTNRVFEQWLQEDSIHIEHSTLLEHSDTNNLAKIVFFSYQDLDEILIHGEKNFLTTPYEERVLNSRIISATMVGYKFGQKTTSPGISVTLSHLVPNATNPVCVVWDYDLHTWSDDGCSVLETNTLEQKTVCRCNRFSNYGLMMTLPGKSSLYMNHDQSESSLSNNTILTLEIAIYVAATLSLIFICIIIFKYRMKIYKLLMKYDCFKDEKKSGLSGCPKSQSFYNGVNLMSSSSQQNVVPYKSTLSRFITDPSSGYSNGSIEPKSGTFKSYQLDSEDPMNATKQLRDVVYMSPQLSQLTNTLKAKKKHCNSDHFHHPSETQIHCESMKNDDTILPEKEVVFRAVSPHGHVYWEIDPKKEEESSDDVSRQSSNRYSDNRSLIREDDESGSSTPANVLVNPFAELSMISESLTNNSHITDTGRFNSLRYHSQQQPLSSSQHKISSSTFRRHGGNFDEVQRQVQIRDIRSIPASVKSNDYILAKIQNHMGRGGSVPNGQVFRENSKHRKV